GDGHLGIGYPGADVYGLLEITGCGGGRGRCHRVSCCGTDQATTNDSPGAQQQSAPRDTPGGLPFGGIIRVGHSVSFSLVRVLRLGVITVVGFAMVSMVMFKVTVV